MSTLTVSCQLEDEMARENTGHPPSYAEAKKKKSLTLHMHGCLSENWLQLKTYFYLLDYIHPGLRLYFM